MDSEDCHQEKRSQRQANEWEEGSEQDRQATDELGQNAKPRHEMRRGHADGVQDRGEGVRPPGQLGETVLQETIANNESQRDWNSTGGERSLQECKAARPFP